MSGYYKHSMSNNAIDAYQNGYKPISRWNKENILNEIKEYYYPYDEISKDDISIFEKWNTKELKTLLYYSEWHHTGNGYNETDFYGIDYDEVEEYINGKEKPVIKTEKKVLKTEEGFYHGEYKETEWHPYSKHNKYTIWYTPFKNAKKKGEYIILENGKKKKFSNCINVVHTKYKRRKK